MQIKIDDNLLMNNRFGAIKKIETMYQTVLKKFHVKWSNNLSDFGSVPYETTQKGRSDMLEFECRKARAQTEYLQRGLR